jgi:hypothetical protein
MTVLSNSLAVSCAYKSGEFGVIMRDLKLGLTAFASGTVSEESLTMIGTGFDSFSEYLNDRDFIFPSDKYPGLYSASNYVSYKYTYDFRGKKKSIIKAVEHPSFLGEKCVWSAQACPAVFMKLLDIYKNSLVGKEATVDGVPFMLKPGFFARNVKTDMSRDFLHIHFDQEKERGHIFLGAEKRFFGAFNSQGNIETILSSKPEFPILFKTNPYLIPEISTEETLIYEVKFKPGPNKGSAEVYVKFFYLWKLKKSVKFFLVEEVKDPETAKIAIVGSIGRQKFIEGCCRYKKYSSGGLEVSWGDFKFEDHWHWTTSIVYYNTKPLRRSIKTYRKYDVSKNAKILQIVYDKAVFGKFCVWNDTGVKGQLLAGFKWRAVDGSTIKQISLKIEAQDKYTVIGCGMLQDS